MLANSAYVCNGDISEWAKCDNHSKDPPRIAVEIPSSVKTDFSFLNKKFKVQTRALRPSAHILPPGVAVKKEEVDGVEGPRIVREKPPLYNLEFVIIGKTEQSKDDIKTAIQRMGGKLGTKIHDKLAAIISTEDEVKRMGSRMTEAKELQIQVVPEHFLDTVKGGYDLSLIMSMSICDWGSDVRKLIFGRIQMNDHFDNFFFSFP